MAVWHQACLNLQAHPYLLSAPVCTAPLYRPAVPPVPQAIAVLTGLALCTEAVLACADIVVAGGGLPVLLGIAQASGRSKEAAEALRAACLARSKAPRAGALAVVGNRSGSGAALLEAWPCAVVMRTAAWQPGSRVRAGPSGRPVARAGKGLFGVWQRPVRRA